MLGWAAAFLILALIAGALGYSGLAGALGGVAQILFWIFIALLVLTFVIRAVQGRSVL